LTARLIHYKCGDGVKIMFVLLMFCIFAASLVSSMVGQGGGVLYTPVQVWLGTDVHQAATTSLFLIIVLSFSSSIIFARSGRIDWPPAIVLESITTTCAFAGGIFSIRVKEDILLLVLAGAITTAALPLILGLKRRHREPICRGGTLSWQRIVNNEQYCINLLIAIPVSGLAGLVSGMVGVGGGILKVAAITVATLF
jgi:uncharacterized membrane protein YfcA